MIAITNKHEALTSCCDNVGQSSATLVKHQDNTIMYQILRTSRNESYPTSTSPNTEEPLIFADINEVG